jgi:hypothetical protein
MQRLRRKAKVAYRQNAARHSFASYHIANFEDATKTAIMLGHPNGALLYSTYRQQVKQADAELYWSILPKHVEEARAKEQQLQKEKILDRFKSRSASKKTSRRIPPQSERDTNGRIPSEQADPSRSRIPPRTAERLVHQT